MFFANRLLKRFSPRPLLIVVLLFVAARLLLYSIAQVGWQVLSIQLLHGFTFPLVWVAGVAYADRVAPAGMSASAQGLFGTVLMGLGAALGSFLGGMLIQTFSPSEMYRFFGLGLLLAALLFAFVQKFLLPEVHTKGFDSE
jgi:predicted MFS family arabinose efflux permease